MDNKNQKPIEQSIPKLEPELSVHTYTFNIPGLKVTFNHIVGSDGRQQITGDARPQWDVPIEHFEDLTFESDWHQFNTSKPVTRSKKPGTSNTSKPKTKRKGA